MGKRYANFTKIVATVPGKCSREFLKELADLGMNVVRLNTAHMNTEDARQVIADVRAISSYLSVLIDTKGPNIRTCGMSAEISVKKDDVIRISGTSGPDRIQVNYPPFADEVPVGSRLICDDGAAAFLVTEKTDGCLVAKALFDCVMRDRKSINVPDVSLHAPALSGKDREFLSLAAELDVDFIAHSFVRSAADVLEVRQALGEAGKEIGIIAKIENREGVRNLSEILDVSDGVMVARGDLGIEIPLEEVPAIQKQIIHSAMEKAKIVITATQMLQSMENSPMPTRAEVSDVANAVYDGTDAVMLSGETAHGRFPREAVAMMKKIVMKAEETPRTFFTKLTEIPEKDMPTAFILATAVKSAEVLPIRLILCNTFSGKSVQACSAMRPNVPIFATTPSEKVMRRLILNYGVYPVIADYKTSPWDQVVQSISIMRSLVPNLHPTDLIMLVGKHSPKVSRNNLCCLSTIEELEQSMQE